jgi:hypothetical protein
MAGLSGPARSDDDQLGVSPGKGVGEVMLATGGSIVRPGVSTEGFPKDCSKTLGSSENWLVVLCVCEK